MKFPIQPIEKDKNGILRFKENRIVNYFRKHSDKDLNDIATMDFTREEHEQFAQLIGYSIEGLGDLSYASEEVYEAAYEMNEGLSEKDARIKFLEERLNFVTNLIRTAAVELFKIHPEDLET
jgi:hypothetical protein